MAFPIFTVHNWHVPCFLTYTLHTTLKRVYLDQWYKSGQSEVAPVITVDMDLHNHNPAVCRCFSK